MLSRHSDPIAAIATAPGRGGVGIVRISGKALAPLVELLCGRALKPREATYLPFRDADGQPVVDRQACGVPKRQVGGLARTQVAATQQADHR